MFTEFAILALQTGPRLELLRHCQSQQLQGLPSWAPDWSVRPKEHPLWNSIDAQEVDHVPDFDHVLSYREHTLLVELVPATWEHYHAAANTSGAFQFAENGRVLQVKGTI